MMAMIFSGNKHPEGPSEPATSASHCWQLLFHGEHFFFLLLFHGESFCFYDNSFTVKLLCCGDFVWFQRVLLKLLIKVCLTFSSHFFVMIRFQCENLFFLSSVKRTRCIESFLEAMIKDPSGGEWGTDGSWGGRWNNCLARRQQVLVMAKTIMVIAETQSLQ